MMDKQKLTKKRALIIKQFETDFKELKKEYLECGDLTEFKLYAKQYFKNMFKELK